MIREAARIAEALAEIDAAYWAACDRLERAVNPTELGGAELLHVLDAAFDAALVVEDVVVRTGCTWAEARREV